MNYKLSWDRNDSVIVTDSGNQYMIRATYRYSNGVLRLRENQYIVCTRKKILGVNLGWFESMELIEKHEESLKQVEPVKLEESVKPAEKPSMSRIIVFSDVVKEGRICVSG